MRGEEKEIFLFFSSGGGRYGRNVEEKRGNGEVFIECSYGFLTA